MKFRNRNIEHITRSSLALILFLPLVSGWNGKPIPEYLIKNESIRGIVVVTVLLLVIWLAFGKLKTPAKA
jgi:hypothetical protein